MQVIVPEHEWKIVVQTIAFDPDAATFNKLSPEQQQANRETLDEVAEQITPTANKAPFEKASLALGSYYIVFTFYSSETISTDAYLGKVQTENLTVVDGKTSTATIALTSFDAKKSVTYVTNRTTGDSKIVLYSDSLKSDATKTNRTFVGWYRESNYSGEKVSDTTDFDDHETLYARWGGAALDINIPVGAGAGKKFKRAYLHIPGVANAARPQGENNLFRTGGQVIYKENTARKPQNAAFFVHKYHRKRERNEAQTKFDTVSKEFADFKREKKLLDAGKTHAEKRARRMEAEKRYA